MTAASRPALALLLVGLFAETAGLSSARLSVGAQTARSTAPRATAAWTAPQTATLMEARRVSRLDDEAERIGRPVRFARAHSAQLAQPADNFATFAARRAAVGSTTTAMRPRAAESKTGYGGGSAPRFGDFGRATLFADERRRIQTARRDRDTEVDLSRAAAFVFDVGDLRDELTNALGRQPANFELAKALVGAGHRMTPSQLVQREKEGIRAINQLFLANHRMVRLIVRKYVFSTNLDESDLVQEGNIGLLTAMRLFDPSRAVRFSTFASWHVRGSILRSIMNAHHTIRLPVRVQQEISAIQKEYAQLCIDEQATQHLLPDLQMPSVGSLAHAAANAAAAPASAHERMVSTVAVRLGWKRSKVEDRLLHYQRAQALSLDAPSRGHGDSATVMGDLISCPKSSSSHLHSELEDLLLRDELRAVLSTSAIDEHGGRNGVILRLHYGLEDGVEYTCAQIADMFKLSVSRVYSVIQHELCMLRRLYESGRYQRPED